jgi:hypothetical protein
MSRESFGFHGVHTISEGGHSPPYNFVISARFFHNAYKLLRPIGDNALFQCSFFLLQPARQSILDKKPPLLLLGNDKVENKKIPAWLQTIADTNYVKFETKGSYNIYRIRKPPYDIRQ